jgi:hypothetical protein
MMDVLWRRYSEAGRSPVVSPPKTLINLTPHEIKVYGDDKTTVLRTYPSVGAVRLTEDEPKMLDSFDGVPVHAPYSYGRPTFTFNDSFKTLYPEEYDLYDKTKLRSGVIVSALAAPELVKAGYTHVFAPDTGNTRVVRQDGQIAGTTCFTRFDV